MPGRGACSAEPAIEAAEPHRWSVGPTASGVYLRSEFASVRDGLVPGPSAMGSGYLPTHMGVPEIAAELLLSANIVKTYLRHRNRKLGAHSR
jgi:hypothetical protein